MAEVPERERALAAVCAHFDDIRANLHDEVTGDEGAAAPLERLRAAVRSGAPVDEPLAEVHAALQAGGDALGVYGYAPDGATVRGVRPAGIEPERAETVYFCPTDRCARTWWPQGGVPVPRCVFDEVPLRRDVL